MTATAIDFYFADGGELVGTAQHPIWSLDHQAWIEMKEFAVGDWVEAAGEPLLVVAVESLAANEPVYNLETFGEHVYEAGWSRVLVHNTNDGCQKFLDELLELRNSNDASWHDITTLVARRREDLEALVGGGKASNLQKQQLQEVLDGLFDAPKTGKVSVADLKSMMRSQKIAPDLLDKGVHFNVGRYEMRVVPDHKGGLVLKPVHPGIAAKFPGDFQTALEQANSALESSDFRRWLTKHAEKGFEMAQDSESGKSLEFRFLLKALERLE